jgi:hypothetical protein
MPYVLISPVTAEQFNRGLCRLLRPEHLRGPQYVTDLYCTMHTLVGPFDGWMALELPDSETVPMHREATGIELTEVLSVFVDDGALTKEESEGIVAAVQAYAGQQVKIADFIPASWSHAVYTREALEAAGAIARAEELSI